MSCSCASHWVPCWRSSDASPLSSFSPRVSPGSKLFSRKASPFVTRNGWTYFWMRSRISFRGIEEPPDLAGKVLTAPRLTHRPADPTHLGYRTDGHGVQHASRSRNLGA